MSVSVGSYGTACVDELELRGDDSDDKRCGGARHVRGNRVKPCESARVFLVM